MAALWALNGLAGGLLSLERLVEVAATLGSDCPLLARAPVVMRGRGERVERLATEVAARLHGRRVLLFKPGFGISTPWAFGRMAATPTSYLPATQAETRLAAWMNTPGAKAEELLSNNMADVVGAKFIALPTLLALLRARFGVAAQMSGSGSACFALLADDARLPR